MAFTLLADDERGPTHDEYAALTRRNPFSAWLPWLAYSPEAQIYDLHDNSMGLIWECRPLTFLGDRSSAALAGLLRQSYPEKTVIQFTLFADDDISDFTRAYAKTKTRDEELVRESAVRLGAHLSAGTKGLKAMSGIPVRNFRLIVSVKCPEELPPERVANIQESLSSAGLLPQPMTPQRLLKWQRRLFNGDEGVSQETYDSSRYIRDQIIKAESPVAFEDGKPARIGPRYAACLTPKAMPEMVGTPEGALDINRIIGDFIGKSKDSEQLVHQFLWTTSVLYRTTPAAVKKKASLTMAQRSGGTLAKSLGRRVHELDWILDDLESTVYCDVITSMWLFGRDENDLNRGLARARKLWEDQNYVVQREDHIAHIMLLAALPCGLYIEKDYANIDAMDRSFPMSVQAAANILPVQADFAGGRMRPVLPFIGRKGQLIGIDIYDQGANNHNFSVSAETGAGKSFVTNYLVGNHYGTGSLIRIVDIGGSYEKQAMLCKGRYIDVGADAHKICLNPFATVDRDVEDSRSNEKVIANIVLTMIYSSTGTGDLAETHFTLAKDAVRFAKERDGGLMGLDHAHEYLRTYPRYAGENVLVSATELAHEMAFNMRDFISNGKYGRLFNGKSTMNMKDDHFVVLELDTLLNTDEELFRVVTMQVINAITQDLYLSDRSQQRFNLFDESYKYLSSTDKSAPTTIIAAIIGELYRRARKYGGSTGVITQSPMDFANFGPAGTVINSNSAFRFLLKSKDYAAAVEAKLLNFGGLLLDLAQSIDNSKGNYSEVLFDTPYGAGVGRLCVDPWTYWLYTTTAHEVAQFKQLVKERGLTPKQAIDQLAAAR